MTLTIKERSRFAELDRRGAVNIVCGLDAISGESRSGWFFQPGGFALGNVFLGLSEDTFGALLTLDALMVFLRCKCLADRRE